MRRTHLVILPGARSITQIGALLLFLACPNIAFVGRDRADFWPACSVDTMHQEWLQQKPDPPEIGCCGTNDGLKEDDLAWNGPYDKYGGMILESNDSTIYGKNIIFHGDCVVSSIKSEDSTKNDHVTANLVKPKQHDKERVAYNTFQRNFRNTDSSGLPSNGNRGHRLLWNRSRLFVQSRNIRIFDNVNPTKERISSVSNKNFRSDRTNTENQNLYRWIINRREDRISGEHRNMRMELIRYRISEKREDTREIQDKRSRSKDNSREIRVRMDPKRMYDSRTGNTRYERLVSDNRDSRDQLRTSDVRRYSRKIYDVSREILYDRRDETNESTCDRRVILNMEEKEFSDVRQFRDARSSRKQIPDYRFNRNQYLRTSVLRDSRGAPERFRTTGNIRNSRKMQDSSRNILSGDDSKENHEPFKKSKIREDIREIQERRTYAYHDYTRHIDNRQDIRLLASRQDARRLVTRFDPKVNLQRIESRITDARDNRETRVQLNSNRQLVVRRSINAHDRVLANHHASNRIGDRFTNMDELRDTQEMRERRFRSIDVKPLREFRDRLSLNDRISKRNINGERDVEKSTERFRDHRKSHNTLERERRSYTTNKDSYNRETRDLINSNKALDRNLDKVQHERIHTNRRYSRGTLERVRIEDHQRGTSKSIENRFRDVINTNNNIRERLISNNQVDEQRSNYYQRRQMLSNRRDSRDDFVGRFSMDDRRDIRHEYKSMARSGDRNLIRESYDRLEPNAEINYRESYRNRMSRRSVESLLNQVRKIRDTKSDIVYDTMDRLSVTTERNGQVTDRRDFKEAIERVRSTVNHRNSRQSIDGRSRNTDLDASREIRTRSNIYNKALDRRFDNTGLERFFPDNNVNREIDNGRNARQRIHKNDDLKNSLDQRIGRRSESDRNIKSNYDRHDFRRSVVEFNTLDNSLNNKQVNNMRSRNDRIDSFNNNIRENRDLRLLVDMKESRRSENKYLRREVKTRRSEFYSSDKNGEGRRVLDNHSFQRLDQRRHNDLRRSVDILRTMNRQLNSRETNDRRFVTSRNTQIQERETRHIDLVAPRGINERFDFKRVDRHSEDYQSSRSLSNLRDTGNFERYRSLDNHLKIRKMGENRFRTIEQDYSREMLNNRVRVFAPLKNGHHDLRVSPDHHLRMSTDRFDSMVFRRDAGQTSIRFLSRSHDQLDSDNQRLARSSIEHRVGYVLIDDKKMIERLSRVNLNGPRNDRISERSLLEAEGQRLLATSDKRMVHRRFMDPQIRRVSRTEVLHRKSVTDISRTNNRLERTMVDNKKHSRYLHVSKMDINRDIRDVRSRSFNEARLDERSNRQNRRSVREAESQRGFVSRNDNRKNLHPEPHAEQRFSQALGGRRVADLKYFKRNEIKESNSRLSPSETSYFLSEKSVRNTLEESSLINNIWFKIFGNPETSESFQTSLTDTIINLGALLLSLLCLRPSNKKMSKENRDLKNNQEPIKQSLMNGVKSLIGLKSQAVGVY